MILRAVINKLWMFNTE